MGKQVYDILGEFPRARQSCTQVDVLAYPTASSTLQL